eukprot:182744-Alexandrium_andersonii.AAC.1
MINTTSAPSASSHTKRALGSSGEVLVAMLALSANKRRRVGPSRARGTESEPMFGLLTITIMILNTMVRRR